MSNPDDPIRQFALALGLNGKRWFLMLNAYLDDSGTHGGPYCFLAGYMARTDRWAAFAIEWDRLCKKYLGNRPFKTAAAYREKDPGFIPESGRLELARTIVAHVEVEIWSVLPESEAANIQKSYGVRFDPYRLCFLGVLNRAMREPFLCETGERVAWVFDHHGGTPPHQQSELEASLIGAFNEVRYAVDRKALFHSIMFADDEALCQLQAADFIAWHLRRRHTDGADIPDNPCWEVLQSGDDLKRIEIVWFDHKIEDLLDNITRPSETIIHRGQNEISS